MKTGGKICGIIIDAETKEPLNHVKISLGDIFYPTLSDIHGWYCFEEIEAGNYSLIFETPGYMTLGCNIKVRGNKTTAIDVGMVKSE